MRDVALEEPLRAFSLGRVGQSDHFTTRAFKGAVICLMVPPLPAAPSSFEQDDDLEALVADPLLEPHELQVEQGHLLLVSLG